MADGRPAVPAALKRELYEEAGYRCAIPTCRGTSALEMAHIAPWSEVRGHEFENMIVLCAVDHTRFDRGEIPHQSIRVYKDNLGLLRGRYGDTERRVLEAFATWDPSVSLSRLTLTIPGAMDFLLMYLIKDDIISVQPKAGVVIGGLPSHMNVTLTEKGVAMVERLRRAASLE